MLTAPQTSKRSEEISMPTPRDPSQTSLRAETMVRTLAELEEGRRQGLHLGAQLHLNLNGAILDLAVGEKSPGEAMTVDTWMIWLSSSKPVAAVALAQLWEQGLVELDDPVALHVPEFAAKGKGEITLRHVLTHTGGFRMLNVGWPEASWEEIIATICAAKPEPRWPLGEKAAYHMASSWFLLGEVIQRVSGHPFPELVRRNVFEPLGMHESWIGMPETVFHTHGNRLGKMYSTEKGKAVPRNWERKAHVVGCSPGGNGHGPIRELGRFYRMLLNRGSLDGQRVLLPQTVEALTAPHRVGLVDRTFKHVLDWGLGFIVNSAPYAIQSDSSPQHNTATAPYGYGAHASRRAFGHSGFQSSTAFADPEHDLVVALLVNGQPGEPTHTERFRRLTEAIYEDLNLARESPKVASGAGTQSVTWRPSKTGDRR